MARTRIARPGHSGFPWRSPGNWPIQSPTASPAPARSRPSGRGEARQTSRTAISPKASGRTSSAIHTRTPAAMSVPAPFSTTTSSAAARPSSAATHAPTAEEKISAARRQRPSGMNVVVARARSLPSRAASAAPRNATHSVRCWTNGPDPGMPKCSRPRARISAIGRTAIAASAAVAVRTSSRPRASFRASSRSPAGGRHHAPAGPGRRSRRAPWCRASGRRTARPWPATPPPPAPGCASP